MYYIFSVEGEKRFTDFGKATHLILFSNDMSKTWHGNDNATSHFSLLRI